MTADRIREAFGRFNANGDNAGRANVFDVAGGKLVIDYGHNPAAFQAMGETLRRWCRGHLIGVIGAPGDRADAVLEDGARVAVVVKEDDDKRGRRGGEVAKLLRDAIAAERPDLPCDIVLDEREALESALDRMRPGDVVVMFYDDLEVVHEVLAARRASESAARGG
jgi:cyanophycin synthetase